MYPKLELLHFRRNPFIKLIIPLIISLILNRFYTLNLNLSITITLLLFIITFTLFLYKNKLKDKRYNPIFSLLIFFFIFSIGLTLSSYKENNSLKNYRQHLRKHSYLKGRISEPIIEKKNSYETIITINAVINHQKQIKTYGKVKCYFPKESLSLLPSIGDQLLFKSKLNNIPPPIFPEEFDYRAYSKTQGITQSTFLPLHNFTVYGHQNSIYGYAQQLRSTLIQQFKKAGINGDELSILSALFLGQKQSLSTNTKENFISAGAMHVLAVSGLHVGIILYILTYLFDFILGKQNKIILKTIIIILLIWGFALLTGLSISVLRSSTMFSFLALGKVISRKSTTYNTIACSAFILLIINPDSLFSVGFQLSYLALIGIIYLHPFIYNWFYISNKWLNHIWSITAVSLAAQTMTIPLSIFYFHQIPTLALVSNIFVIYLAIVIITLALFSLIFILISPVFEFIASILNHIINELILIITAIANVPFSNLTNLYISATELFIIYSSLLFIMFYKELKKNFYLRVSITCLSLFFIYDHFENYQLKYSKKLFIYPTKNDLTINLIANDTSIIYTSDTSDIVIKNLRRSLKNNWGNHDVLKTKIRHLSTYKNHSIQIDNKSILIINIQPQKINNHIYDYIIINNSYVNLNIINNTTTGKEYIIGSKVTPIQMKVLENQNRLLKLNLTTTNILHFD